MAVPKHKRTRSRVRKRYASPDLKLKEPRTVPCPQCGEPTLPHRVCPHCGFYKKRKVIEVEQEKE